MTIYVPTDTYLIFLYVHRFSRCYFCNCSLFNSHPQTQLGSCQEAPGQHIQEASSPAMPRSANGNTAHQSPPEGMETAAQGEEVKCCRAGRGAAAERR